VRALDGVSLVSHRPLPAGGCGGSGTPYAGLAALLDSGAAALFDRGDLRAGRQCFDAAYRVAQRHDDGPALAQSALGYAGLWVHEHRSSVGAALSHHRLRMASGRVAPQSSLGLRLRIRLAAEVDYSNADASTVLGLLEVARRHGDPIAHADALSLAHHCLLGPDHDLQRRQLAAELIEVSFRTVRRSDLLMGELWQVVDLFLAGDRSAVRRYRELRGHLAEGEHLAVRFVLGAIEAMLKIRNGDLEDAERLAAHAACTGAAAGDADATGWYGAHLVAIRWYQGRLPELVPMLSDLIDSQSLTALDHSYRAAYACATAQAGDRRAAVAALAALRGDHLSTVPRTGSWLVCMYGVVEAAHLLDDAELAAEAYGCLQPYSALPMMASLAVGCFGSVEHALGVAALTTGDYPAAAGHLRTAVQRNLALAHWPAVVMSRLRYAEALARAGGPTNAAAAAEEHRAAAAEAARAGIGLPTWPSTVQPGQAVACVRRGAGWTLRWGEHSVVIASSVGMLHLAVLTANPGQELSCADLVAGVTALAAGWSETAGDQPLLDRTAIWHYKQRLAQLRTEPARDSAGNLGRGGAGQRREDEWLEAELASATGLGGRPRRFADGAERARVAVGKAIRRAIAKISAADPVLGEHLREYVHTGTRCVYRPVQLP
jgi:hypothetical protein